MPDNTLLVTGGVDTHKDFHVCAALDERGRVLGTEQFPTTLHGYRELLDWLREFGQLSAVGVEGTGSWGAGLSRFLTQAGVEVIEVNRPNRQTRRRRGKSDLADAEAAARTVLAGDAVGIPKSASGAVEAIRLLRIARRSAMKARTQAANQIHSVIDTAPEELRSKLLGLNERERITKASKMRVGDASVPLGAAKLALVCLARRWIMLTGEVTVLDKQLTELVESTAPSLIAIKGVGIETAGALLAAAGDNPTRLRSDRSFAAMCGSSPVTASSGRRQDRHRLNRGGDRQANCALFVIVLNRLSWHQPTKDYMAKRTAEGKTKKEIIRCLKRYVAREVYRAIMLDMTEQDAPLETVQTFQQAA
jgi:transposase